MNFLEKIRPDIEQQVRESKQERSLEDVKQSAEPGNHSFRKALNSPSLSVIAEFKQSSPSRGTIAESASLPNFMNLYDRYADAISILTEPEYFSGKPSFLKQARQHTDKPLLRKDFVIDEYQIYEARDAGADAVLLIESLLEPDTLYSFRELIEELGMDALVECHDPEGLKKVRESGANILGINNRNIETLEVDLDNTRRLVNQIETNHPDDLLVVAESGLHSRSDVLQVQDVADAVLIGTAIMDAPNPELKLMEISGRTLVKFCGITSVQDAEEAVQQGADVLGLNFYEPSPRFVEKRTASRIAQHVNDKVLLAGVFVNSSPEDVQQVLDDIPLDLLQFSGDETPDQLERMKRFELPLLKALHVRGEETLDDLENYDVSYLMVDAFDEEKYGGTGKKVDETILTSGPIAPEQLVVAGGLTPDNVKTVLEEVNPLMVDVCSGIETEPGRKDPEAMKAFMDRIRNNQG